MECMEISVGTKETEEGIEETEKELLSELGLQIYVFMCYSTDLWDDYTDNKLGLRKHGRILSGADAAPEILRRIPRWRWLSRAFALPGARPLSRRAYAWIARYRMKLSCSLPSR